MKKHQPVTCTWICHLLTSKWLAMPKKVRATTAKESGTSSGPKVAGEVASAQTAKATVKTSASSASPRKSRKVAATKTSSTTKKTVGSTRKKSKTSGSKSEQNKLTPRGGCPQAQVLLELHLQHELAAFDPSALVAWFRLHSVTLDEWLKTTAVGSLVTREQIRSVIQRYFIDAEIPEFYADLTRESAQRVLKSGDHQKTLISEIMTATQFDAFLERLLDFEELRGDMLHRLIDLPVYGELISGVVYEAIIRYIYENNILTKNIPGMSSMLKMGRNVVSKTAPGLGGAVEEGVRNYINSNRSFILKVSKHFVDDSLTSGQLRDSAGRIWDGLAEQTLEDLLCSSDQQVLALLMLGYDYGSDFRKTAYFALCTDAMVASFFDRFGSKSLIELMEDSGVSIEKINAELEYFLPSVISALRTNGCLETLLRARLQDFYDSAPVVAFFET